MIEFHQNLYLVIIELHELKELMFSLLDKKEKFIAEYSFVSCSVMNKVVKVFVINTFLRVGRYTTVYFVKVLFSSRKLDLLLRLQWLWWLA